VRIASFTTAGNTCFYRKVETKVDQGASAYNVVIGVSPCPYNDGEGYTESFFAWFDASTTIAVLQEVCYFRSPILYIVRREGSCWIPPRDLVTDMLAV